MTNQLTLAERFFYDNAGYSYGPGETAEQGRIRGAVELAAAEARLKAGPYFVGVEQDPELWDEDVAYDGPLWIVSLYSVEDSDRPMILGSLCSVSCESGDDYLRVVAAELADEYIPTERGSIQHEHQG